MFKKEVALGCLAEDKLTGVRGHVAMRKELLPGNVQYAVQPLSENGLSMPDAWHIDEHTLVFKGKGLMDLVTPVPSNTVIFRLGQTLRCKVTGFVGIATSRVTHMNGCVYYHLEQKANPLKPNDAMLIHSAHATQIEFVDNGLYVPALEDLPKPARVPGGISTRVQRI